MAESQSQHRFLEDENLQWVVWPVGGVGLSYVLLATATWLCTVFVGGGAVWMSPAEAMKALWGVVNGDRIDVWILTHTEAVAVAAPMWFWVVVALLATGGAVAAVAGYYAFKALGSSEKGTADHDKKQKERKQTKDQRKAAAATVARRWPLMPPYDPVDKPGPGVLLGTVGSFPRKPSVSKQNTPVLVVGPTGSGKTRGLMAPNVARWPGPVVATSVKLDDALLTLGYRLDRGPVRGFDPGGRLWPAFRAVGITPVVWDPVRLLQASYDKEADGLLLSTFLMSQTSARGAGSQDIWATLARQTMHRLLIIAVDLGADLEELLTWVLDPKSKVVTPLRKVEDQLPELSRKHLGKMNQLVQRDGKIFDSIAVTMEEVADTLDFTAGQPDAELIPTRITTDGGCGTLYLVADHLTQESHRPLFAAALRHLFHMTETFSDAAQRLNTVMQAERAAQAALAAATKTGAEDDPLLGFTPEPAPVDGPVQPTRPLFALDEMANLAPLPDLPAIISTIRTRGQVLTGIQAIAQLRTKWGDDAVSLRSNHPTIVEFGGGSDAASLSQQAQLSGLADSDAAEMRMLEKDTVRVTSGAAITFDVDVVDLDKWIDPKKIPSLDDAVAAAIEAATAAPHPPTGDKPETPPASAGPAAAQPPPPDPPSGNGTGPKIDAIAVSSPAEEPASAVAAAVAAAGPVVELFPTQGPAAQPQQPQQNGDLAAARVARSRERMKAEARPQHAGTGPGLAAARVAASAERAASGAPPPGRTKPRGSAGTAPAVPRLAQRDAPAPAVVAPDHAADEAPEEQGHREDAEDVPQGAGGTVAAETGTTVSVPTAEEMLRVAVHTLDGLTMPGETPSERDTALVAEWASMPAAELRDAWNAATQRDNRTEGRHLE